MGPRKVYCAGPLFNDKEREEMAAIASTLEGHGFATFLPQRDGLELTRCVEQMMAGGFSLTDASRLLAEAIFALDVYQVLCECDLLVANLNGRVPDEGTVSEAAMAWARGKPVLGYKSDARTAFAGEDNPLVTGLFQFRLFRSLPELGEAARDHLQNARLTSIPREREEEIDAHLRLGREISRVLAETKAVDQVVETIARFHTAENPT